MSRHSQARAYWKPDASAEEEARSKQADKLVEKTPSVLLNKAVSNVAYAYELYEDRADLSERAIDFYHRVFGALEKAAASGVRAEDVLRGDPKLYKTLSMFQTRQGGSLHDLFPAARGRRRLHNFTTEELVVWALEHRKARQARAKRGRTKDGAPTPV